MEYAVMAETHEGKTMVLRRGFGTQEAAEDHPVQMNLWKRVWVAQMAPQIARANPPVLPPKPWDWVASNDTDARGQFHAYLVDATGRKIAAIWGGAAKELIADHIIELANREQP